MHVLSPLVSLAVSPSCPDELRTSISNARSFSSIFDTTRPIAFHDDCHVMECRVKRRGSEPGAAPLLVVVKTYLKLKMSESAIRQSLSEVQIHSSLPPHDHIIPLLAAIEDSRHLYLVIEKADDGDLRRYLSNLPSSSAPGTIPIKASGGTRSSYCLTSLASMGPSSNILDYHPTSPTKFGSSGCLSMDSLALQGSDETKGRSHSWSRIERDDSFSDQSRDSDLIHFMIKPLLNALVVLHSQGVVHRDLKPENVLIHKGRVMIADLGLSIHSQSEHQPHSPDTPLAQSQEDADGRRSSSCPGQHSPLPANASAAGTPLYAAPEVLRTMFENKPMSQALSPKNDVWALGVMVLEALLGYHPMTRLPSNSSLAPPSSSHYSHAYSGGQANMLYNIAHLKQVPLPESTPSLSDTMRTFLSHALNTDPSLRPNAMELLAMINK